MVFLMASMSWRPRSTKYTPQLFNITPIMGTVDSSNFAIKCMKFFLPNAAATSSGSTRFE